MQLDVMPEEVATLRTSSLSSEPALQEGVVAKKLSVLHVGKFYPPHKGGMEIHLKDLCERLRHSVDTEVLVAGSSSRNSSESINGVRVTRAATLFDFNAAPVCPGMVRLIRQNSADIIHMHFPNPTGILAYLAAGHSGRLVVTYHSDIIRQKIMGRGFQPILDRFLGRASAIICTSPVYIDSSPVLSRFRERCRVIPLGITTERLKGVNEDAVAKIRARFGPRIVLGIGRLIYYKGFDYLIRAMKNVDGHLLIIGDGPLRNVLAEEARRSGVAGRVTFLGEVENVVPYLQAADVFALASIARSEAFGIVQLEAMACGKPVVNTRLQSGVPWVSIDGVTGITVPPADAGALAAALNRLLSDPSLRAQLGAAGRLRVEEEFRADLMVQRTLDLYEEVINSTETSPFRQENRSSH